MSQVISRVRCHCCQGSEGNTKHWRQSVAWPHSLFIHHRTADGMDIAVFTLALGCQYRDFLPPPGRICNYRCLSVCLSISNVAEKLLNGFA